MVLGWNSSTPLHCMSLQFLIFPITRGHRPRKTQCVPPRAPKKTPLNVPSTKLKHTNLLPSIAPFPSSNLIPPILTFTPSANRIDSLPRTKARLVPPARSPSPAAPWAHRILHLGSSLEPRRAKTSGGKGVTRFLEPTPRRRSVFKFGEVFALASNKQSSLQWS